jgi:hypothetical protein
LRALDRYGWRAERVSCAGTTLGEIFVATR